MFALCMTFLLIAAIHGLSALISFIEADKRGEFNVIDPVEYEKRRLARFKLRANTWE